MIIMDLSVDPLCHCERLESRPIDITGDPGHRARCHKSELPLYAEHAELSPPVACFAFPTLRGGVSLKSINTHCKARHRNSSLCKLVRVSVVKQVGTRSGDHQRVPSLQVPFIVSNEG